MFLTHVCSYLLANINISKLDAAYDIDPLFHKLSQKFDEGGAKGLLLVNLGVAQDGCRIILDSKEDSTVPTLEVEENEDTDPLVEGDDNAMESEDIQVEVSNEEAVSLKESSICKEHIEEGMVDISGISSKLQELLMSSPLEATALVPQLEDMRIAYEELEEEGFSADAKQANTKVGCGFPLRLDDISMPILNLMLSS